MEDKLLKYTPLDKSWIIRMGMLDLINGPNDILSFLNNQEYLGDDLLALKRVSEKWDTNEPLNVGESGTLYRFVRFALWKQNDCREIIKEGTLKQRKLCNNSKIINWSLEQLLTLDNHTSQWASASVLMGNKEVIKNPPYKLKLTYEAVNHWNKQRHSKKCWQPRYDATIERQARAFVGLLENLQIDFIPEHSEDYCFARAFNLITTKEAEEIFPSLKGHETNRLTEMDYSIKEAIQLNQVSSKDHRIVQALAMKYKSFGRPLNVKNPDCVKKSWPQFWKFLDYYKKN